MLNEVTMERVVNPENMRAAYLAVKANGGSSGVDGMEVGRQGKRGRRKVGRSRRYWPTSTSTRWTRNWKSVE